MCKSSTKGNSWKFKSFLLTAFYNNRKIARTWFCFTQKIFFFLFHALLCVLIKKKKKKAAFTIGELNERKNIIWFWRQKKDQKSAGKRSFVLPLLLLIFSCLNLSHEEIVKGNRNLINNILMALENSPRSLVIFLNFISCPLMISMVKPANRLLIHPLGGISSLIR